ncbi:MAG: amino acid--tRNA ligase-related protein [Myxococcota bacterium]|nr:amino acid--tRNA ligase-related protein [Myxococcota bacterium]
MAEEGMRNRLQRSHAVRSAVRRALTSRGLIEVVTPISTLAPGGEPYLEAPSVELTPRGGNARRLYLRTSPEVWHKRLLSEGSGPIFEIAPCFRDHEAGPWHDLEFEMVEWYRPGATLVTLQEDCSALIEAAYAAVNKPKDFRINHRRVNDLFHDFIGIEIDPEEPSHHFAIRLQKQGIPVREGESWDELFYFAWVEVIEPKLKPLGMLFVSGFPASQAAMAKLEDDDPRYAERFELYLHGIELANAFAELTDGSILRARYQRWQKQRIRMDLKPYPEDAAFFTAVDTMPPTVGIALGLDRLTALAIDATDLADVKAVHLGRLLGGAS